MQQTVIVVGGGLAGLTSALHLAERGLQPLVIEADTQFAGGRVAGRETVTITGADGHPWTFRAEHGIHGLWSQYRNLDTMLARHALTPKLVAANRQQWVHGVRKRVYRCEMGRVVRRSWIPAPFHYAALFVRPSFLNMLTLRDCVMLPWVLLALLVAVGIDPMAESKANRGLDSRTMADLCRHWPPSLKAFVASLGRSGLSAHPEAVPLSGFIAFMRFYTLLRRDSQAFRYFAQDSGTALIEPMIARIEALGGEVCLGRRVRGLEKTESGWRVYWQPTQPTEIVEESSTPDKEGLSLASESKPFAPEPVWAVEADFVVLATDAPGTAKILNGSLDTQPLAANLKWPGALETVVVRAWFDLAPPPKAEAGLVSGNFTIDNFFWLQRFQDDAQRWHKATGGSVAEMHIYGPPETVALANEVLQLRAVKDLQRVFPTLRGHLLHTTVQRNAATHTLFGVGPAATHLGTVTPWPGLFCCGDWVRHPTSALFLERACVTGIAAANAVLTALEQPTFEFTPMRPPELLARLIQAFLSGASRPRSRTVIPNGRSAE